jgi:TnpA family transposase
MAHRELLTESQRVSFHAPATDERGMVRHYTLSAEDLALINRRRSDPNRLGFAVMLCYLRFPGRILREGEQPPAELCGFIAEQLGLDAAHFGDYAERDQTRREHVLEIEAALGLRPLSPALYREVAAWLLPTALATDHGPTLVTTILEELRVRRIVCPPLPAIERLGGSVRARAQRQLWRLLTDGLTEQQRRSLDQLLEVRVGGGQSTLAWLRQTAYAATTGNFPKLIERLSMVRALGIEPERATRVHQNYWLKLAREECYTHALASLTDTQCKQPLAAYWGSGTTSSSDAQFFRAGGRGEVGGLINLHYGQDRGVKFYTHLSDQVAPFHTKVIAATANEAPHVLDGLLYHQSSLVINEHYTNTGGFSDHVFAMCRLLGFLFAPRIRDLKDKRLYILPGMKVPPELASLATGVINVRVITAQWNELLRLATSIKTGTVTASVILRKLAAYPRQNGLALALKELGKVERTLFTLQWLQDPELRRRSHVGLNKGEQQNALRRAVFFNRLGEIRDRSYENQRHRATGLNLIVSAIVLWNTTYLQRAVDHLRRQGHHPQPGDLAHLSPLGWEHINLTGDYHWENSSTLGPDQFRPLRTRVQSYAAAA